ncbi:alpha/beta fold hydrolase [Streptomyces sp. NPDC087917]|uniref:thioesterase II family protein n=1 Tax=unclassified Streptomyces TaxID=2593676 RepID=UPI0034222CC8
MDRERDRAQSGTGTGAPHRGTTPEPDTTWLRRFGPAPADRPVLVCLPHAGGAASAYLPLSRALAGGLDVLAVQYPGRQDRRREQPFTALTDLADAVARAVAPLTGRPYAVFGHSMGAVVGYETVRRLAALGLPLPRRLYVSGRGAPTPVPAVHDRLVTDAQVLAAVAMLGGTGRAVLDDPEMLEMLLPTLRADYRALGSYGWSGGDPLPVPVTALIGDSDPVVTVAEAAGWRAQTRADFSLQVLPGGHFYLHEQLPRVAGVITDGLAARVKA